MVVIKYLALLVLLISSGRGYAIELNEERVDLSLHSYSGEGVDVTGPAILIRKNFDQTWAVEAGLHVDDISNASVDTLIQASEYSEQRTEFQLDVDYLFEDTLFSTGLIVSTESDHKAYLVQFEIAQEFFAGMSVLSAGYGRGFDDVERSTDDFSAEIDRHHFKLNLKQILANDWYAVLSYQAMADSGFLANPYRLAARNCTALVASACEFEFERFPETRVSHAVALTSMYYVGGDVSLKVRFRGFTDTWDIGAVEFETAVAALLGERLRVDLGYRFYTQSEANFYFDNTFVELEYLSRDKELSAFDSHTFALDFAYDFHLPEGFEFEKFAVGLSFDFVFRDFSNYTDLRDGSDYQSDASVLQLFIRGDF